VTARSSSNRGVGVSAGVTTGVGSEAASDGAGVGGATSPGVEQKLRLSGKQPGRTRHQPTPDTRGGVSDYATGCGGGDPAQPELLRLGAEVGIATRTCVGAQHVARGLPFGRTAYRSESARRQTRPLPLLPWCPGSGLHIPAPSGFVSGPLPRRSTSHRDGRDNRSEPREVTP
jgi:hypothetical protein